MITQERYEKIREQLIVCHSVITQRLFDFRIFPTALMTTDQVRDRAVITRGEGLSDPHFYETIQVRPYTIVSVIPLLSNITDEEPIVVDEPLALLSIYETIQEYNSLWYELYLSGSGYFTINPAEMEYLERLSFYLHDPYRERKSIEEYKDYNNVYNKATMSPDTLMDLSGLMFSPKELDEPRDKGFISYYQLCTTGRSTQHMRASLPDWSRDPENPAALPSGALRDSIRKKKAEVERKEW